MIRNNSPPPIVNDTETVNSPRDRVPRRTPAGRHRLSSRPRSFSQRRERTRHSASRFRDHLLTAANCDRVPTVIQQPTSTAPTTVTTPDTNPIQNISSRVIGNPNQRQYTLPAQPMPSPAPGQNQNQLSPFQRSEISAYPQQINAFTRSPLLRFQPRSCPCTSSRAHLSRLDNIVRPIPRPSRRRQPSIRSRRREPKSPRQVESRQAPSSQQWQQQQEIGSQARSQDNSAARETRSLGSGQGGGGGGGVLVAIAEEVLARIVSRPSHHGSRGAGLPAARSPRALR